MLLIIGQLKRHSLEISIFSNLPLLSNYKIFSRLVGEVGEIQESIGLLNDKLRESQTVHQDLLRNKSRLEHDLAIKSNSLVIDRQRCLGQRKNLPFRLMK